MASVQKPLLWCAMINFNKSTLHSAVDVVAYRDNVLAVARVTMVTATSACND
jgi:hypothetical protein